MQPEFTPFPKIHRLSRECIITEKLDGTNAQIFITDAGEIFFGSRCRWLTPQDDNYGFAKWATEHKEELLTLGPGHHFGEWWGQGIQRNYGLKEKRFSLFNVIRWCLSNEEPCVIPTPDIRIKKWQKKLPPCVSLVPVLCRGIFNTSDCYATLSKLQTVGSFAVPGFMNPEGIVCFHVTSGVSFKKTLLKDEEPKSKL